MFDKQLEIFFLHTNYETHYIRPVCVFHFTVTYCFFSLLYSTFFSTLYTLQIDTTNSKSVILSFPPIHPSQSAILS